MRLRCDRAAPLGVPVVPEVYRITAGESGVTSFGVRRSAPKPPMAELVKDSQGTVCKEVFLLVEVSAARASRILGRGMRRASCWARGMALVMFTLTTVSSGVSARSFSSVSAALSHAMATRAPWSRNWGRSSWAV